MKLSKLLEQLRTVIQKAKYERFGFSGDLVQEGAKTVIVVYDLNNRLVGTIPSSGNEITDLANFRDFTRNIK